MENNSNIATEVTKEIVKEVPKLSILSQLLTPLNKILIGIMLLIVVSCVGFVIYKEYQFNKQKDEISKSLVEQKQLLDNIVRSQSSYATQNDLNAFAKQNNVNLDIIKQDMDKLGAQLTSVNNVIVSSHGQVADNLPSTGKTPNANPNPDYNSVKCDDGKIKPCPDPFHYQRDEQKLTVNEQFTDKQVPFGEVGFSAWKDKPWSVNIPPRSYSVTNVVGTDENGKESIYNKFNIMSGDKVYEVKIDSSKTEQVYPSSKFYWWNPRLFISANGGVNLTNKDDSNRGYFSPSILFGTLSYGQTKIQPDLYFGSAGVGYDVFTKNVQVSIVPISYNLGKNVPIIKNTFIGPNVGIGLNGDFMIGAGITIGM